MAAPPRALKLTRQQIAAFAGDDFDTIRQIERLFNTVDAAQTTTVDIEQLASLNGLGPQRLPNPAQQIDTFDFNRFPAFVGQEGRAGWDAFSGTLGIGLQYNVFHSVGFQTFARVENNTGVLIPAGTVVGFAGVGSSNVPRVTPFIADGSVPSLYVLGVMAHDLPDNGQQGNCIIWGALPGVDTSAFAAGDILYASPTVAGAFTATKPTAPNNVIPVAAVLLVSSTEGVILVRPTIEQQKHYGEFTLRSDLSPAAVNTAYPVQFTNTEIALGLSLTGSPTTRITASQSGLYHFTCTLQISSGNTSAKDVSIWFARNGAAIANTRRIVTININNGFIPVATSEFFSLNAGDYIEVMYASSDVNITIDNVAATAFAPEAPAAIVAVTQVQQ